MNSIRPFAIALILATTPVRAVDESPPAPDSGGWRVLFDGRSFNGWKKSEGSWTLEDRAAVADAGGSSLTRDEPLPREFEMEFECWCDDGVQLMFLVELKNGILDPLVDVEAGKTLGDEHITPRVWHKMRLSCRPKSPEDRKIARSVDGRAISTIDGRTSYSMQFYVTGGGSKIAKLRNIRVKDLAKAGRDKAGAD